jgi:hypothetical protein
MEYFLLCLRGTGGSSSSCLRFYFDGTVGRVVLQRKKFTIRSVHNLLHYLGSPSETDPSPLSSQKMRRPIIADKLRPCYAAATFATKASCTGPIPVLAPQRPDHGGYDLRRTAAPAPRRPQLSNAPSELTFGLVAATSPLACVHLVLTPAPQTQQVFHSSCNKLRRRSRSPLFPSMHTAITARQIHSDHAPQTKMAASSLKHMVPSRRSVAHDSGCRVCNFLPVLCYFCGWEWPCAL